MKHNIETQLGGVGLYHGLETAKAGSSWFIDGLMQRFGLNMDFGVINMDFGKNCGQEKRVHIT
eukprot:scaffold5150_cov38-Cyclotella_meneghiniana.AAC.1